MKKVIYILVFLALVSFANAQWVQYSNGIGMYNIRSFVLNGNTLFTGTEGQSNGPGDGIYYSNNYGTSWTYSGLTPHNVQCLALSGTNILAGTSSGGIFISTNNGGSWTAINNGLTDLNVEALLVNGTFIYAGTGSESGSGFFISTNNGVSWSSRGLSGQRVHAIAISGSIIFAGTKFGVYVSSNNGINWNQTTITTDKIHAIAIYGTKIFAGGDAGIVYFSNNNGTNWTLVNNGLPAGDVTSLALIGSNLFAGMDYPNTYWGVYYSSNNGSTWITKNEGFSWSPAPPICTFLITSNYIFAGTGGQVWRRNLSEFISIKNISSEVPDKYSLSQNYPNPFNPSTNIKFQVKSTGNVKLVVFDMLGKEVATLVNEKLTPGTYEASFNGSNLTSGVYFYKLTTDNFSETKKMLMIK